MASRIAGITVEIGGNVGSLPKALESVNKVIKNTQTQLKDVERLLKLDPTNMVLLTQKQEVLKTAIASTKEKLEALKTAQEQAKTQMENGDLGKDKYDALQREIIATEEELERLAKEAANANTNVSMMGETFKYAAPIAGALGYTAEDTALAIGLMANAGIKSSQAGTSLRSIMTNLTSDIKIAGAAIGEVAVKTTNADGSMRSFNDIIMDCRSAFANLTESEKANTAEALVGKNQQWV